MALKPQQERGSNTPRNKNLKVFLRQKIVDFLPPMWRGNDADMPLLTHDQIWFLRENQFLFFTRNGPVEITVKPIVVLATALVGLVGISVIFLSTIFASYSAIEVIRDESIQTAEASIESENGLLASKVTVSAVNDQEISRQNANKSHKNPNVGETVSTGKTSIHSNQIVSRVDAEPRLKAPFGVGITIDKTTTHLPSSYTSKSDGASENGGSADSTPHLAKDSVPKQTKPIASAFGKPLAETAQNLGPSKVKAKSRSKATESPNQMPQYTTHQSGLRIDESRMIDRISPELSEAKRIETSSGLDENNSFAESAAGFAIAMLPRFLNDPNPSSESINELEKSEKSDNEKTVFKPLDDGFAMSAWSGQSNPRLPSISEPARAKKMLLSLNNEINYIRESIRELGIKSEYLPEYTTMQTQNAETDFKELLIALAEHRAALRKIPFKTPMLYFYISSDYGYRKHPKTGLRTFHHGIDLAGTWQENVRATAPGTVVFAGREGSFGKVVRIEHEFGISTLYAHLSRITVNVGTYVNENAVIGKMGNTGRSAGAHLHYEIQVNGQSVDPSDFFTIGRQMSVAGELRQSALTD